MGGLPVRADGSISDSVATPSSHLRPRDPSALLSDGSMRHKAFRLGNAEPPAVTLLKELVPPLVVVGSLLLWLLLSGAHPALQTAALSLIVFLVSNRILSLPELRAGADGRNRLHPSVARLLLEWCAIAALLGFLATTLGFTHDFPRQALLAWLITTPAVLSASNYGTVRLARWWSARRGMHRHIIIGATEIGLELAKRVERDHDTGQFLGFFDFRDRERLPPLAPEQWVGACAGVAEFVQRHAVDSIYIALPISTAPRIAELLQQLRDTTASIYFVPNLFGFDLVQPRCLEIHGIPALAVCESPHHGMSGLRKRTLDIMLAIVTLALTGPLMLAIAAGVKLTSPGPVLFRQRRYGLNGEEMCVFKFRSMTVCEDGAEVRQATVDDRRTTPFGRFLRRSSLDELPQVLNVLAGKMSFVGPRPHAVAHNEQYRKLIRGYMIRHKVRPGITGWAQVNGLRGETDIVEKMRRRIEFDIDYMNNWSMWLDIKILARTLLLIFRDDRAY